MQPMSACATQDRTRDDSGSAPLPCTAVLTHHWLVRMRGGEKVLAALTELLPAAEIYTLVHDADGVAGSALAGPAGAHVVAAVAAGRPAVLSAVAAAVALGGAADATARRWISSCVRTPAIAKAMGADPRSR